MQGTKRPAVANIDESATVPIFNKDKLKPIDDTSINPEKLEMRIVSKLHLNSLCEMNIKTNPNTLLRSCRKALYLKNNRILLIQLLVRLLHKCCATRHIIIAEMYNVPIIFYVSLCKKIPVDSLSTS